MDLRLFDFKWFVDPEGYDLVTHSEPDEPATAGAAAHLLLSGDRTEIKRRGGALREYVPFKLAPRLHRDFAEQVTDANSALAFVERYGFLGSMFSGPHIESDRVEFLVGDANAIRMVLDRIDHPKRHSSQSAAEFFNDHVKPHLTIQIEASKPKWPFVQIVPRSLISWMWLCVAEEIANGVQWRLCANPKCRSPFSVDQDQRRQRRIFCTRPACRQAAKRARDLKERAKHDKQRKEFAK